MRISYTVPTKRNSVFLRYPASIIKKYKELRMVTGRVNREKKHLLINDEPGKFVLNFVKNKTILARWLGVRMLASRFRYLRLNASCRGYPYSSFLNAVSLSLAQH